MMTAQTPITILGIPGSIRRGSYNQGLLVAAQELLPRQSTLKIASLAGIPVFNQDVEDSPPEQVMNLKRQIAGADAVLFAIAEHNYSVSGALKNALDWISRPYGTNDLDGKPGALMGASIGKLGASRAQYSFRKSAVSLNIHLLNKPEVMVANAAAKFDDQGRLIDESTRQHIQGLLLALFIWTKRLQLGQQAVDKMEVVDTSHEQATTR